MWEEVCLDLEWLNKKKNGYKLTSKRSIINNILQIMFITPNVSITPNFLMEISQIMSLYFSRELNKFNSIFFK